MIRLTLTLLGSAALIGCIATTPDDDEAGDTGPASTTSGTETTAGDSETSAADSGAATSSTSGSGESSGAVVSGTSGGFEPDCSRCSAEVEPDPPCNSSFNPETEQCECDLGYEFVSDELDDFECEQSGGTDGGADCGSDPNVEVDANGDCTCVDGYEWCSEGPDDLTCCEVR